MYLPHGSFKPMMKLSEIGETAQSHRESLLLTQTRPLKKYIRQGQPYNQLAEMHYSINNNVYKVIWSAQKYMQYEPMAQKRLNYMANFLELSTYRLLGRSCIGMQPCCGLAARQSSAGSVDNIYICWIRGQHLHLLDLWTTFTSAGSVDNIYRIHEGNLPWVVHLLF